MNNAFENAKQGMEKVMNNHGLDPRYPSNKKILNELLAVSQEMANETVREDREDLNKVCELNAVYIGRTIRNRPLPFPEQP